MSLSGVSSSALQSLLDSAYPSVSPSSTDQTASTTSAVSSTSLLSSSSSASSSSTSLDPVTQDLVTLLKDLASGNASSAKTALTQLQKDIKSSSADPSVTRDLTSFFKDLASGNTTSAQSDVKQLELDLGIQHSEDASGTSNSASSTSETALGKLVNKLADLLNNGNTEGALQEVASYLVQQGLGSGSLVNTSA